MLCRDLAFSLGNAIVDCLKDSVIMYCLREVLNVYLIRAALLAKYEGETVLVVLSGPDFCIFRVDWLAWYPAGLSFTDNIAVSWYQADHTPCAGLEDADVAEGEGLANFVFVHEQATKPVELTRAANIVEELPIWVGPIIYGVAEQEFKRKLTEAKESFLTVLVHEKLTQLRDVTFEAASSRAEVSLGFQPTAEEESKESSGNISDESLEESFEPDYDDSDTSSDPIAEPERMFHVLTFLDDVARERFKTGVAAWMSRSVYTSKWKRRFNDV
ncbi:MAG: uncharacterized protein KVP18_003386 [Porospora cf. gigantea A]|nr:MAG: hypothetical protein KVP18_003386 [Porospora cf. gigantea A]